MNKQQSADAYWLAVQQDRDAPRELVVLDHGVTRCTPYPSSRSDAGTLPESLRLAEVRMWARRAVTVANRVKMRAAQGRQPSRDELAQVNRYTQMILACGMTSRPSDQLA